MGEVNVVYSGARQCSAPCEPSYFFLMECINLTVPQQNIMKVTEYPFDLYVPRSDQDSISGTN